MLCRRLGQTFLLFHHQPSLHVSNRFPRLVVQQILKHSINKLWCRFFYQILDEFGLLHILIHI